jgi:hypothetical protein
VVAAVAVVVGLSAGACDAPRAVVAPGAPGVKLPAGEVGWSGAAALVVAGVAQAAMILPNWPVPRPNELAVDAHRRRSRAAALPA